MGFLGREIQIRREAAGLTQQELGRQTLTSRQLLAAIEAGTRIPKQSFIERAEIVLRAGGTLRRLYDDMMDGLYGPWFGHFVKLEKTAKEIRVFSAQLVPGLLQTEEYARALYETHEPPRSAKEIEEQVAARMARQQILVRADPPPPRAWFILDEAVLRRWPNAPDVARPQLRKLLEVGKLPHVTILVVPFAQGTHAGRDGSQIVLSFEDSEDIGYVEPVGGGLVVTDFLRVAEMRARHDVLLSEALSADQSAKLIREIEESL
ncbi:helix-turn-helix domain-containing protein [Yinghuangia soli]|uniref:Helix-turn-helix transcriptional regulator n=1 Tax=Yinghuangia soli TaxID=2908204 RepID=A0AA41U3M0_9ACTN|nr:helix-turn-helix transcriptional regulator [Yinghuangia soli]MCF2531961.1 helix-turn-helix transcriptional regulator [Yinghuangia soli]